MREIDKNYVFLLFLFPYFCLLVIFTFFALLVGPASEILKRPKSLIYLLLRRFYISERRGLRGTWAHFVNHFA